MNILNLPRWNVTAVKENAHDYRVEATIPEEAPGYCGKCHSMFAKVYKSALILSTKEASDACSTNTQRPSGHRRRQGGVLL